MGETVKRFGAMPVDETSCDLEPIHLAGAVQPPAVMVIAVDGRVEQISENSSSLLGREAPELVGVEVGELPEPLPELIATATELRTGRVEVRRRDGWTYVAHHHLDRTVVEAEPDAGAIMPDELLERLRRVVDDVDQSASFADARTTACHAVRELTGFDRVMVYLFHEDGHGEVVAESTADGVESFLGLHYPATDIPRQARRLFVINPTRVIADMTFEDVPLVGAPDSPVADLTYSQFRATSPIHRQYLRNMGVAASFSLSLVVDGELVGLIAAHHRTPRRLAHDTRSACGLIARILSEQLGRAFDRRRQEEESERLGAQFLLLRHLALARDAGTAVDAAADDLRRLLRSDGLWRRLDDRVSTSGSPPADDVLRRLGDRVPVGDTWQTAELPAEHGFAGGVLISRFGETEALCWFRDERRSKVTWAGDPGEGWDDEMKTLNPRASFAAWEESVSGRCEPWSISDQAIASTVSRGLRAHRERQVTDPADDFQHVVEGLVWYAAELEMVNVNLEATNADLAELAYVIAHDLRAPLRSIRSFLQIYREDLASAEVEVPEDAQENWQVIEESATTMQRLLNALLEWARIRPERVADDTVMLEEVVGSAVRSLRPALDEVGATVDVGPLGKVVGDQTMLRQLFVNLLDNAIKYRSPDRPLQLRVTATHRSRQIDVAVSDNGIGIPELAQDRVFRMFDRAAPQGIDGIGAGLAIVERIVERHRGSIELTSTEGIGTAFVITLPSTPADLLSDRTQADPERRSSSS